MSTPRFQLDPTRLDVLDEAIGYLNFSSGASDPKFLRSLNAPDAAIDAKWMAVARRRREELLAGKTEPVDGEEVFSEIANRFAK